MWEAGVSKNVFQVVSEGKRLVNRARPAPGWLLFPAHATGKFVAEAVAGKWCLRGLNWAEKTQWHAMRMAAAAAWGVEGAFYNNGQSCCAVERIYVHEKIYDEYPSTSRRNSPS